MESGSPPGRLALVTGAAHGIGAAVARELAERGVALALVDRDGEALDVAVKQLRDEGHDVCGEPLDVTDGFAVEEFVERLERTVGPVDILVNVAGVLRTGPVVEMSDSDWETLFAVNTTGVFHCCRSVGRRMSARGDGAVVTVASNAAAVPRMNMAAYGASKAASVSFTKALGLELAATGVRCNVVAPGSTDTGMLRSMWHSDDDRVGTLDGSPCAYRVGIPLRKLGQGSDIAHAVAFLVSSEASHITMQELCVDGGAALGA
ncbi:2,3-dihydro-2,3-dihydroxybenzoate dehydrogenase [Haloactinomyces albus]|uniref:2,3-dihydro-2,3-dihydroxybenzoate dehydrogenase n=1 Tax=Haloactinomyces albus TaxID=1352928 RepID=A0AAE4CM29_9ACTN|nr:2,3-dihydro-2,3-dihydroxybenzoate dehydrogenase [Haloactinomyces albus]MDR7301961.1 2,3-dihydro-2,3-dihydroxybenzoate dehydrogenase [Haloactinomyces albus]